MVSCCENINLIPLPSYWFDCKFQTVLHVLHYGIVYLTIAQSVDNNGWFTEFTNQQTTLWNNKIHEPSASLA